jgi:hypothetical protein
VDPLSFELKKLAFRPCDLLRILQWFLVDVNFKKQKFMNF